MKKRFLFVMQRSPHGGSHAWETLDQLLTTAAFEQNVTVLLVDDGVFLLKKGQEPHRIDHKDIASAFSALNVYGIENIFVEEESLHERGLLPEDLLLPVTPLARSEIGPLLAQQDVVLNS